VAQGPWTATTEPSRTRRCKASGRTQSLVLTDPYNFTATITISRKSHTRRAYHHPFDQRRPRLVRAPYASLDCDVIDAAAHEATVSSYCETHRRKFIGLCPVCRGEPISHKAAANAPPLVANMVANPGGVPDNLNPSRRLVRCRRSWHWLAIVPAGWR
jgi:hypothetical protein